MGELMKSFSPNGQEEGKRDGAQGRDDVRFGKK